MFSSSNLFLNVTNILPFNKYCEKEKHKSIDKRIALYLPCFFFCVFMRLYVWDCGCPKDGEGHSVAPSVSLCPIPFEAAYFLLVLYFGEAGGEAQGESQSSFCILSAPAHRNATSSGFLYFLVVRIWCWSSCLHCEFTYMLNLQFCLDVFLASVKKKKSVYFFYMLYYLCQIYLCCNLFTLL